MSPPKTIFRVQNQSSWLASHSTMQQERSPGLDRSPWFVTVGYAFITMCAIGVRLYKAHVAGIVHDEAITFQLFGQSFHDALTLYPFSNNHVINSLLVRVVQPCAGVHEHFIRLPSLVFATAFVVISWRMCRSLFTIPAIGLACHAALVLSWYPLDLSFQARAYGGLMACNLVIIWLLAEMARKPGSMSLRGATGFGALVGLSVAMLPTNVQFATVAALVFAVMVVTSSRRDSPSPADAASGFRVIAKLALAASASSTVVGITYAQVASQILAFFRKLDDHYVTAARFVQQSFGWWYLHSLVAGDVGTIALVVGACGLLIAIGWSAAVDVREMYAPDGAARRVVMTTIGGYVLLLVVLNYGIGMSLGFARNRVDTFLFFLLAGGLALDHAVTVWRAKAAHAGGGVRCCGGSCDVDIRSAASAAHGLHLQRQRCLPECDRSIRSQSRRRRCRTGVAISILSQCQFLCRDRGVLCGCTTGVPGAGFRTPIWHPHGRVGAPGRPRLEGRRDHETAKRLRQSQPGTFRIVR